jgi:hypothetical protein
VASLTRLDTGSVDPAGLSLLQRLSGLPWADDFYLAGSAALTLYLAHRPVRDLDLMSPFQRLRAIERRDHLQDLLQIDAGMRVETARDGFLYVRSGEGVGLRFYYYPYPLIAPQESITGIAVASPADLGLMKLGAIISRGTRRDFVDLYLLCQQLTLQELLERSQDKFGHVRDFPLQAIKGLADRSQVAGEPMPELSRPLSWDEVELWLEGQVRGLGRQQVGLD